MHSVCVVARLRDSSYVWDMKVVSSSYGDATHPCRDCRVAKPFSADALRRKGERERGEGLKEEASEAGGAIYGFRTRK